MKNENEKKNGYIVKYPDHIYAKKKQPEKVEVRNYRNYEPDYNRDGSMNFGGCDSQGF